MNSRVSTPAGDLSARRDSRYIFLFKIGSRGLILFEVAGESDPRRANGVLRMVIRVQGMRNVISMRSLPEIWKSLFNEREYGRW